MYELKFFINVVDRVHVICAKLSTLTLYYLVLILKKLVESFISVNTATLQLGVTGLHPH